MTILIKKFENVETALPSCMLSIEDALNEVKARARAKFDESVDLDVCLAINPSISSQSVKGMLYPPCGLGKKLAIAVVGRGLSEEAFKEAGAEYVGFEDLISDIADKKVVFDKCFALKSAMPALASNVAKILGPKGLMPDHKVGTVLETEADLLSAVAKARNGVISYKNDKSGILHCSVGRVSFSVGDLKKNICAFFEEVVRVRPVTLKGGSSYVLRAFVSSTMGPSFKIDLNSVGGVK